ncbi:MAG: hypothetical protein DI538_11845 [Azospira oryzae]|nr:MAG: hypothetical protein DI538_11845 [Azospira oryzae]
MMKKIISVLCLIGIFAVSCKDDDQNISSDQKTAVQDQATADAYFNDASDLSTSAYNSPSDSNLGGRAASGGKLVFTVTNDTRFNGATLTLDASGTIAAPKGTISIDFGAGTTDPSGTLRKGKIMVAYTGYRFVPGSSLVITFDGYEVNGIKVEGQRTVITSSVVANTSITFAVKDENGKLVYTDGTFVTRTSDHTRTWILPTATAKGQWQVQGNASGVTRDLRAYTVAITTPLIYKAECALQKIFIPSEGEATLTVGSTVFQLNYGDQGVSCDKTVTVNVGGITTDVTVN